MKRIDRTGEEKTNNFGSLMRITKYRNNNDVEVYFPEYDYTKEHTKYSNFITGKLKCPYERRLFGVGYMGEERHNGLMNKKGTKCYDIWSGMMKRAYDPKYIQNRPTYKDCIVSEEWHNFQNFSDWFQSNYYEIEEERMALDKDILYKGNKIYSPNTCIFAPTRINTLFIKCDKCRGDLPVGVTYKNKKYVARCRTNTKLKHLGYYDTPEEAFQVYKKFKENYIKEVAEEYKKKIPTKLYTAMINYEVEIDD